MSTSALPLPSPPSTLSGHHHHSNLPPSHLSLPNPCLPSLEEPHPHYRTPTIRSRLSKLCQEGQPHIARQMFETLPRPTTVLWNTIIIGFICNNMPTEALLFYSRMRSTPSTKCDSYTYSSILKACANKRQSKFGKAVHCHVLRSNINASRIVYNSLLNMYSSCLLVSSVNSELSEVDLVRRVFRTMKKRNVVAWNIMIAWYAKTERFNEAVAHFRWMMKTGIKPTAVSFVNVFPAVSGLQDFRIANVLYGLLFKFGCEYHSDLFVVSSAISMYSQMGYLKLARRIFDRCLEKNAEVWNTMIGGYVQNCCYLEALKLFVEALESEHASLDELTFVAALTAVSQLQQLGIGEQLHAFVIKNSMASSVTNGLDEEGLMLVKEMQKQGFVVDSVTATALLSAASNLRSELMGKQTHAYLIRHGIHFEGMHSYLIDMYAKFGLVEKAQQLFEEMNDHLRDQATWNAMISANVQNGLMEEAFVVFGQMLERNVMPNAVTMASVLPACSQMGNAALGKQLHGHAIRHYLDHNVFVGTALVDMYSKTGAIASAENVFSRIPAKNPVTYTNMILGYGQHGMGATALSLFDSMQVSGTTPDSITFIAVLSACSYAGLIDEGLQIFYSMETKYGIKPLTEHYCCVIDMLGRVGRLAEAFQFAKELVDQDNAIKAWGLLLAACKIHGQYKLAKIVADKLLELDIRNSSSGYLVLLSNIYADEGNWEYVDTVRKQMQERGLKKEVGCSCIEISGCVNCFVSKDQNHQKCEDIYEMLAILAVEMMDAGYGPHHDSQRGHVCDSDD
ncbi:hypothetical protein Ancab_034431 [Ancistrocladus abbreviatus]